MQNYIQWVGTCVELRAQDLNDFDNSSRDITYRTFCKYVGHETIKELNQNFGVPLHRDYHVNFAIGKWKGQKAVCLFHSSIHHIWIVQNNS